MKPITRLNCAADLLLAGLLVALAGCANDPVSHFAQESSLTSAFAAAPGSDFQPPTPVRTVAPVYPLALRRNGVAGVVKVSCLIDEKGRIQETKVLDATDPALKEAALTAVSQWTFQPARRAGVAVPAWVNIPIRFVFAES